MSTRRDFLKQNAALGGAIGRSPLATLPLRRSIKRESVVLAVMESGIIETGEITS